MINVTVALIISTFLMSTTHRPNDKCDISYHHHHHHHHLHNLWIIWKGWKVIIIPICGTDPFFQMTEELPKILGFRLVNLFWLIASRWQYDDNNKATMIINDRDQRQIHDGVTKAGATEIGIATGWLFDLWWWQRLLNYWWLSWLWLWWWW